MSWQDIGIKHKRIDETLALTIRVNLSGRGDLPPILNDLLRRIPVDAFAGPPFAVIRFITSVESGLDADLAVPVARPIALEGVSTRTFRPLDVLSLVHEGPIETLRETYRRLYGAAADQGLISDEFAREVYLEWGSAERSRIEVQFVLHDWSARAAASVQRVLGVEGKGRLMGNLPPPSLAATLDARFDWVKTMVARMEQSANAHQTYDILSSCAHVFPQEQIDKLTVVYEEARARSENALKAVDAVTAFMGLDPGWGAAPHREGHIIYATKAPRDAQAHAKAQSDAERRSAYCFCPIIRSRLENGMPPAFCNCGAGWYRQQWEGAIGRDVRISIVKSILRGDDACQFAIQLPDDL